MQVTMIVNGEEVTREIEGRLLLVHFLRDVLGLTGTHWGCDTSNCGTCVVWMDSEPVKSCTVLGMMMTARALLDRNPNPSEQEIREAISGQICRCTGYATIVRSVRWAADHEREAVTS